MENLSDQSSSQASRKTVFVVRPEQAEDAQGVQDVYQTATADLRRVYVPRSGIAGSVVVEQAQRLVATEHGEVIGVLELLEQPRQFYIQALAVATRARCRGVAKQLLLHVEQLAKRKGKQIIVLRTVCETGNFQVFSRLGFVVVDREKTDHFVAVGGGELHILVMHRDVQGQYI